MSMQINNPTLLTPTTNNDSTKVQSTANVENKGSTDEKAANKESDIKLSSRAHKIQMLNEEFFPGGPASVAITPGFIQRLHEYGFISDTELEKLDVAKSEEQKPSGTLGELSKKIDSLSDRLTSESPDDSLIGILTRADAIINNLDGSKPSPLTGDIKTVSAELNAYMGSSDADKLADAEKKMMDELSLTLKIADKLNPNNASSQKLNSYLSFM
ncbi:hypothetical protein [Alkalimarinus coralli]|uniref:hypothetical protein n=1 Tax=Alkalimarinus coralli TaxID=2935863 RepID=UPI00202B90CC|nr:hypothetical protein [Alkalimarinus coralli]